MINFPSNFEYIVVLGSRDEGMADPSIYEQAEVLQDVMFFDKRAEVQT